MTSSSSPDLRTPPSPHPVLLFLSGSIAGCWAETVTQPLDCTKIRMQLQEDERRLKPHHHHTNQSTSQYRGTFRTALTMIREEGFLSLYSGLPPAFARQTIKAGMQMSMYRWIRDVVATATSADPRHLSLWQKVLSASLSGVIGQAIANPADVVKVRLQADGRRRYLGLEPRYTGTIDAIRKIYHQAGIRGFWTGCIPSLQRSALTAGGGLASYDHIKHWILQNTSVTDQTRVHIAVSAISSGISTLLACPPDVIKTRIMNQSLSRPLYHGTWHCFRTVVAQEGLLALYKGFIPTYVRIAPWQMCFFTSYEFISHLFTGTRL